MKKMGDFSNAHIFLLLSSNNYGRILYIVECRNLLWAINFSLNWTNFTSKCFLAFKIVIVYIKNLNGYKFLNTHFKIERRINDICFWAYSYKPLNKYFFKTYINHCAKGMFKVKYKDLIFINWWRWWYWSRSSSNLIKSLSLKTKCNYWQVRKGGLQDSGCFHANVVAIAQYQFFQLRWDLTDGAHSRVR